MATSSNKPSQPGTSASRIAIKRHLETLRIEIASAQRLAAELYPGEQTPQRLATAHTHIERALQLMRAAPTPVPPAPSARPKTPKAALGRMQAKHALPVQVTCPYCMSLIPQKLLESHIQQKHSGKRLAAKPKKKAARSSDGGSARASRYFDPNRDPFDGGRSVSESRREDGRFGSLPVYDSFDEESYP